MTSSQLGSMTGTSADTVDRSAQQALPSEPPDGLPNEQSLEERPAFDTDMPPNAKEPQLREQVAQETDGPENWTQPEPLAAITASLQALVVQVDRYHDRAEAQSRVVDHLHDEVERLRRGERRLLLRPILVEMARLRSDLLRQADTLPADFDATKATALLRAFADTLEIALEDNGVTVYRPEIGEQFDPHSLRRAGGVETDDPSRASCVAEVRADGYRDEVAEAILVPAQVLLFAAAAPATSTNESETS